MAEEPSDAELIERSRDDPESFAPIFDRYFRHIHRYVASRVGPAADDIASDTFLVAFRRRDRYDTSLPLARAWLFGIATNLIRQHRRDEARYYRARKQSTDAGADGGHADRVVDRVSAERMQPQLAAGLAGLSEGDRDVLLLVAYAQLPYNEVAIALDIPMGTVGSRLNRARTHLRRVLEQEMATHE
ncbi:RNA polymerase sigma factor [Actinomadura sp. B10D3]|uniref:RNA polymerase sigma factor n=1 Tax=Actinomadura sp. B10D3 TaxID=3153557 RepID=UPI00325EFCD3